MKKIKLGQQGKNKGKFTALVSDEDYEYINQWRWYAIKHYNVYYARRYNGKINGKKTRIYMHRVIMNTPAELQVDHIDHNGLNNQRHNLRNCTSAQNHANAYSNSRGKSKYLGVSWDKNKYIRASLTVNGKNIKLGYFKTEINAALAYDEAARKYHGEFANPNFK